MVPQRSHISLKRGLFYYRRRTPKTDSEITVSLRTHDFREVQYLGELLDRTFLWLIESLQHMPDLQAILRHELGAAIEKDRARHANTPTGKPVYAYWADDGDDAVGADLEAIEDELADARRALQRAGTCRLRQPNKSTFVAIRTAISAAQ